jgi:hypothetical protein
MERIFLYFKICEGCLVCRGSESTRHRGSYLLSHASGYGWFERTNIPDTFVTLPMINNRMGMIKKEDINI